MIWVFQNNSYLRPYYKTWFSSHVLKTKYLSVIKVIVYIVALIIFIKAQNFFVAKNTLTWVLYKFQERNATIKAI